MPRVGVVIPLFNHARFIGEALASVRAQTRPAAEMLVVDDGSTDGSAAIARELGAPLFAQENAGAHAALNRGIGLLAASCDVIAILNSDDVWEPSRLERAGDFLAQNAACEIVCTDLRMIDLEGNFLPPADPRARWKDRLWRARRDELAAWLGIANFTKTTSNLVARTAWLQAHPFRPYRYVHDYALALETALAGRLAVLAEPLLRYRVHGANTIKSGEPGAVPREAARMWLDLWREAAPALATSAAARARWAAFLREAVQNHAELRVEGFLAGLAAGQFVEVPEFTAPARKEILRREESNAAEMPASRSKRLA